MCTRAGEKYRVFDIFSEDTDELLLLTSLGLSDGTVASFVWVHQREQANIPGETIFFVENILTTIFAFSCSLQTCIKRESILPKFMVSIDV